MFTSLNSSPCKHQEKLESDNEKRLTVLLEFLVPPNLLVLVNAERSCIWLDWDIETWDPKCTPSCESWLLSDFYSASTYPIDNGWLYILNFVIDRLHIEFLLCKFNLFSGAMTRGWLCNIWHDQSLKFYGPSCHSISIIRKINTLTSALFTG